MSSFLQFARISALSLCLAVGFPARVFGETAAAPQGSEFSLYTAPGDQTFPRASVSVNGGFVVWQDNVTDGKGFGISGMVLDNNLLPASPAFRVNHYGGGDQEKPRVALLKNGGAVWVWQGGQFGFQHVFARFLSSSNTWLTSDIRVSSPNKNFQIDPAVAVLENGNVVMVWGSFNQRSLGSMQDIYGQLFTPEGEKIGGEFAINQFSQFNQRSPSVIALQNGGFMVAWISEQQRSSQNVNPNIAYGPNSFPRPSVDVFSRVYAADGSPAGAGIEFGINAGTNNVCANPEMVQNLDGSVVVVWSERDSDVRNNRWDVFAARVTLDPVVAVSPASRINTQLFGDQFVPRISRSGSVLLAVWTSFAQDGSREGVFGRFLNSDTTHAGAEFRVNTTTLDRQDQPSTVSDDAGRFLVVWGSYMGLGTSLDVKAQRYITPDYIPVTPSTNYLAPVFEPPPLDNNPSEDPDVGVGVPKIKLPDAIIAGVPLPKPFSAAAGSYYGLFADTNGVSMGDSGYFKAAVTSRRTYTAKLQIGAKVYTFSGRFNTDGLAQKNVPRRGQSPLAVSLQLNISGGDQMVGVINGGSWTSQIVADRRVFSRTANPAPYEGRFTLVVPGKADDATVPAGSGYGSVTVDRAGVVTFAGVLADGTKVTRTTAVSKQGDWPLYIPAYSGKGALISWLRFANSSGSDVSGDAVWIKPSTKSGTLYSDGFTSQSSASGSIYPTTSAIQSLSTFIPVNGSVVLSGGGLTSPLTVPVLWTSDTSLIALDGSGLILSVTSRGLWSGTVTNPDDGKTIKLNGAIVKKGNMGGGFFIGNNQSGHVYLNPVP